MVELESVQVFDAGFFVFAFFVEGIGALDVAREFGIRTAARKKENPKKERIKNDFLHC